MPRIEEHEWTKANRRLNEALDEIKAAVSGVACNRDSGVFGCMIADCVARDLFRSAEALAETISRARRIASFASQGVEDEISGAGSI